MTQVTSIILDALRETNLIPLGVTPSTAQQAEAFRLLSGIVAGTLGSDAGENLNPFPLGKDNIQAPVGYPWWDNQLPANCYVRKNSRLMLNLTGPGFVYWDPNPTDGARMGVVDCAGNLDTNPITLYGNGRLIDGASSLVINLPNTAQEWCYREDIGTWVTVTPLALDGEMPWPSEFDDLFIIQLALRLNPRYGQVIHPASMERLKDIKSQFNARYSQYATQMPSEDGLLFLTNIDVRNQYWVYGNSDSLFDTGFPF